MMIARSNHYPFYVVFEVNSTTYDDIRERLERSAALWKQRMIDEDGEEILVFGSTAFKKEK